MTPADDTEAFFNSFECTATRWPKHQWLAELIPCLVGSAQKAVNTLSARDIVDYQKVLVAILQMLSLSPETYQMHLREIEFGSDYQPRLMADHLREACMR